MRFDDYYRAMRPDEKSDFAARANTTRNYIENWLLAPIERRKTPRRDALEELIVATEGNCSKEEVLQHFYPDADPETNDSAA